MANGDSIQMLKSDLKEIKDDPGYKPFQRLIADKLEPMVNVADIFPESHEMAKARKAAT